MGDLSVPQEGRTLGTRRPRDDLHDEWLEQARQAAQAGQPLDMLDALNRSRALDGIARRLQAKWEAVAWDDLRAAVADATDVLYAAVQNGSLIQSLVGFVWKVADRTAARIHRENLRTSPTDFQAEGSEERLVRDGARPVGADVDLGLPLELDADDARKWAVSAARELLLRLGQRNVQDCMAMVLDAVERGVPDLSNQEIAGALGLSLATVRTSLSRGFDRLAERAAEAGMKELMLNLKGIVDPDDEG